MQALSNYSNTVYELNVLKRRLNLILNYETEIALEKNRLIISTPVISCISNVITLT